MLFIPCMLVNNWHCQYFSCSHKILSMSLLASQNTCSMRTMRINWMAANRIKMPRSSTTIFLCFNIWLVNTETLFKRSGKPNILTFTINTLYQINDSRITCKITSDLIFLTSNSTNKCAAKEHVVFRCRTCYN